MTIGKPTAERIGQKERTRQALLHAACALVDDGETLTIARVAERAGLAEATAYRYYRNPRSLLRDALSIDWHGLDEVLAALRRMPDIAERAELAAVEMAKFVLAREPSIRLLFAATELEPRDGESASGLPKASFRHRLVEAVLHDAEARLGTEFRTIQLALIVVISPQAVLMLCDAMPREASKIPAALGLIARRVCHGVPHPR